MKVKVVKKNVGMAMYDAITKAREVASTLDYFRVQLWRTGEERPVATWATIAGDAINEILKHSAWGGEYKDGEGDYIKVIDDGSNKVVETILVNG